MTSTDRIAQLEAERAEPVQAGQGYTLDNIRVVSLIANTAMNGWGEDALRRLIRESRATVAPAVVARTGIEPVFPA